jgi:TRAP-type uncharacterized transport system substrate-binding protein
MKGSDLKTEILKEISRKAYELQIKAGLAQNNKMDLDSILQIEKSLHHEIKRLSKLAHQLEKAQKRKEIQELEQLIYAELNLGV